MKAITPQKANYLLRTFRDPCSYDKFGPNTSCGFTSRAHSDGSEDLVMGYRYKTAADLEGVQLHVGWNGSPPEPEDCYLIIVPECEFENSWKGAARVVKNRLESIAWDVNSDLRILEPDYLRGLIMQTRFNDSQISKKLGLAEYELNRYLSGAQTVPYTVQYALESIAFRQATMRC